VNPIDDEGVTWPIVEIPWKKLCPSEQMRTVDCILVECIGLKSELVGKCSVRITMAKYEIMIIITTRIMK
jgi:hypothetical protein